MSKQSKPHSAPSPTTSQSERWWQPIIGSDGQAVLALKAIAELPSAFVTLILKRFGRNERIEPEEFAKVAPKGMELSAIRDFLPGFAAASMIFSNLPEGRSIADAFNEMASDGILTSSEGEKLGASFQVAAKEGTAQIVVNRLGRDRFRRKVRTMLPLLQNVYVNCVLIPQFDPQFDERDDDIDSYSPAYSGVAPMAVVQFDVDEYGSTNEFSVALDNAEVDTLIRQLQAVRKQMDTIEAEAKND